MLLNHPSIDVNAVDSGGGTPLHVAVHVGCPEDVDLLLKAGADINARDEFGRTPLHRLMENRKRKFLNQAVKKLKLLLQHKDIDVNAVTNEGETPLHHACQSRVESEILKTLLGASGLNVNVANARGETPMDFCRSQEWTEGIAVFNELHFDK